MRARVKPQCLLLVFAATGSTALGKLGVSQDSVLDLLSNTAGTRFAGLVDPLDILGSFQQHTIKEVLSPTRTFEFNNAAMLAHYHTMTSNLQVRSSSQSGRAALHHACADP